MALLYHLLCSRRRSNWLAGLLALGWFAAQGQSTPPTAQRNSLILPYSIPKSPTVTDFPRYDKQSLVQLHTGGAQYSIPIITLQSGALHLPVSLAYFINSLQVYQPREPGEAYLQTANVLTPISTSTGVTLPSVIVRLIKLSTT